MFCIQWFVIHHSTALFSFKREIQSGGTRAAECKKWLKFHQERARWRRQTIENAKAASRASWAEQELSDEQLMMEMLRLPEENFGNDDK